MKKYVLLVIVVLLQSLWLEAQPGFAVVELFTSEGCGTCPPAEKLLNDIADDAEKNHQNIFCLEYHVDYWNHDGWKDPFSKKQFTMRQDNYLSVLHERELYTPQMIVNGVAAFAGSNADKAITLIEQSLKQEPEIYLTVDLDSIVKDSVYIRYTTSATNKNFSLHIAFVESGLVSKVTKGENSGKTFTHNQVARIFYSLGLNEKSGSVIIPLKGRKLNRNCSIIAFVQNKQTMKITSAVKKEMEGILKRGEQ